MHVVNLFQVWAAQWPQINSYNYEVRGLARAATAAAKYGLTDTMGRRTVLSFSYIFYRRPL